MRPLVWGQAVSLFGDYLSIFALPLYVVALRGSPVDLGLVAAAETIPMLLFGLLAGVFLDRRIRLRETLIVVDVTRAAVFLLLAVAAFAELAEPIMVFIVAFLAGTMAAIYDSGLQALMPAVLEEDRLISANSHIAFARTAMGALGPLIAGLAVTFTAGFGIAFGLNAVTFLISAAFLAVLRPVRSRRSVEREAFGPAIREGLRFLFADRRLRWSTLGGTLTNFVFAPLEALLVFFVATRILGLDVGLEGFEVTEYGREIGLFFAVQALLGAAGVALAPRVSRQLPLGTMYVVGLVLFGGGFLGVAVSQSMWAVIPSGVAMMGVTWVNVSLATLRQRLTPPQLLGRVIAASRTLAFAGIPAGAAVGGIVAGTIGVVPVYVVGSSALLAVAALVSRTALVRDRVMADPGTGRLRTAAP